MPCYFGGVPERSKGSDCKSDGSAFEGSNPSPSTSCANKIRNARGANVGVWLLRMVWLFILGNELVGAGYKRV